METLGLSRTPYGPISAYVPTRYHQFLGADILGAVLLNSHSDETLLQDSGMARGHAILVLTFQDKAYDVPHLNNDGMEARRSMDPNIFNIIVDQAQFESNFRPYFMQFEPHI